MLNKDYTSGIRDAIRSSLSLDFSPVPNKWDQLPQVVSQGLSDWDNMSKKNAYINALKGGNQDEINQAWSAYDPQGFANYQQDQAKRAEERQWHLDDLEAQRQFQKDLLRDKLNNEFALVKWKSQNVGYDPTAAERNVRAMVATGKFTPDQAWAIQFAGGNPTFDASQLGQKGFEAYDKKVGDFVADEAIAEKQMQTLKPKVENALQRAEESLKDGTGLGQLGGWGWTTDKGGMNRANIKNAQAQINTTMRGLLKQMGVGSTELNSAAEAEAYRYMIDPNMPIGQQAQVLNNFKQDYLSGKLAEELAETYAKPNMKQVNQLVTDPRVQEALNNGYSMEEIQKYLGM